MLIKEKCLNFVNDFLTQTSIMEKVETRKRYDLDRITRMVISIICIVAAIMVINYLSGILLPFVIGGLLAYMLNPFV